MAGIERIRVQPPAQAVVNVRIFHVCRPFLAQTTKTATNAKAKLAAGPAIAIQAAERDGTATKEQLDTLAFLDSVAFANVRGLVGLDASHRDQRNARVPHFLEQAMERSLVGYRAMDDGRAVAVVGEAQPVEPGGPSGIEMPLEADLVTSGLVAITVDAYPSWHLLLSPPDLDG